MPLGKGKTLNVKRVIAKITNFDLPEKHHISKIKKFIQDNNMDCNNDELKRLLKQYTGSISKIQNITQTELFQTFDQGFHTTFGWNLQSLRDTSINEDMSINKSHSCAYRQYYQFALSKVFDGLLSLSDIGISISGSDHSTVVHAIKVCRDRQFTKDKEIQQLFQLLHSMPQHTKQKFLIPLEDILERKYDNSHETLDILADIMHTKEFQNQMLEIVENKPSKNKNLIKKMLEQLTTTYHTIQSQKKSLSQSQ